MNLYLFGGALIPAFSFALLVQQQEASSAPHVSPDAVTITAQRSPNVLRDGTPIKLRLLNKLDSHNARNGDEIRFDVVNDIAVGGVTVLRRGSAVTGLVTQAQGSRNMGRAGRLSFTINDIKLENGAAVPVRAFNRTSGDNRTGDMVGMMVTMPIAAAPFFLLIHGTNSTFPRGTEITAFANGDVRLDLSTF